MSKHIGKVVQVIGPVVDVRFESGKDLPNIYDALHITRADGSILVLEVQQLTGEDTVRTVSMESTDGLARGTEAVIDLIEDGLAAAQNRHHAATGDTRRTGAAEP